MTPYDLHEAKRHDGRCNCVLIMLCSHVFKVDLMIYERPRLLYQHERVSVHVTNFLTL
jgi:hypothetical protein